MDKFTFSDFPAVDLGTIEVINEVFVEFFS